MKEMSGAEMTLGREGGKTESVLCLYCLLIPCYSLIREEEEERKVRDIAFSMNSFSDLFFFFCLS